MAWLRRALRSAPLLLSASALASTPPGEVFVDAARARALLDEGAAVLDARGGRDWAAGHLPGSAPLAWTELRQGLFRSGLLSEDDGRLQGALRAAGVWDARPVLVVGAGPTGWGEEGRLFWMMEYLGHEAVHLLDGGFPAWEAAGGPVARDGAKPPPGDFTVRRVAPRRVELDEMRALSARCAAEGPACGAVLWDTREAREYQGATPYGEARGGHLPGAVHLWFRALTDESGRLLPESSLRARLQAAGIDLDRRVVALCTGGVRSGFAYAVLRHLGAAEVANYDGSMWQWASDPALPLRSGPAP
jgi:thiosulfate/3-mercaptopyruvate sulfurtransferase